MRSIIRVISILVLVLPVSSFVFAQDKGDGAEPKQVFSLDIDMFVEALVFSPDSRYIACSTGDHSLLFDRSTVSVFDRTGAKVFSRTSGERFRALKFSPQSDRLLLSDATSKIFALDTKNEVCTIQGSASHFSADGKQVFGRAVDGIRVFDSSTGKYLRTVLHELDSPGIVGGRDGSRSGRYVSDLVQSLDLKHLIAIQSVARAHERFERDVHLIDCETWKSLPIKSKSDAIAPLWLSDHEFVLQESPGPGQIEVVDINSKMSTSANASIGDCVRVTPTTLAYLSFKTDFVSLFDLKTKMRRAEWRLDEAKGPSQLAASPDSTLLAIGRHGKLKMWRIDTAVTKALAARVP